MGERNSKLQIERRGRRRGWSLVEVLVVVTMMAILISLGIPVFGRALEQSRADLAAANLRALWAAERLYWLDSHTYTADLTQLQSAGLLDPALLSAGNPYVYQVKVAGPGVFTATATRIGGVWTGVLTVDQSGTCSGNVQAAGQPTISPGFQ